MGLDEAAFEVKITAFHNAISKELDKVEIEVSRLQLHADAELKTWTTVEGKVGDAKGKKRKNQD